MTLQDAIHAACNDLGANPPKVVQYDNGILVALRNGDGQRVATILRLDTKPEAVRNEIATLYKVKPENIVSRATLDRLMSPDEIRAFQEGKKAAKSGL